jgi:predicted lactoylglutathione lyase
MKRARSFYEALGWKAGSASNDNVTFFQGNGITLGLFGHDDLAKDAEVKQSSMPDFRGVSLAYNSRSEKEVDASFDHAISCGGKPLKKPEKVFWGGYSGYFADPDGHLWEVAYNPFAQLDENGHLQIVGQEGGSNS